jgi:hypothetical protein
MTRTIDLTGKIFHNLKVVGKASANRQGSITWLCECVCGNKKTVSSDHLTRKKSPVKSCGCLSHKQGERHSQWKGCGDISGGWWSTHVVRERKQSKRAKIPVDITIEYAWELFIKQNKMCALSGQILTIGTNRYNTASIDRIDSSKGYIEGNIQWVHKDINFMKRTYSQEYFIGMCKMVFNHTGGACEIK